MAERIVVRTDLRADVEELIVRVGRQRLLDLLSGALTCELQRGPSGLQLIVDGAPVVFEDETDGSWMEARLTPPLASPPCRAAP